MIINIRGTSGSGKSTVVKRLMERCDIEDFTIDGRKRPLMHICRPRNIDSPPLVAIGHYQTPTGGADTISEADYIFELVNESADEGSHVIYEGLMISSDVRRLIEANQNHKAMVSVLNTPIEQCIESIQERRTAKGNTKILNPANTVSKHAAILLQIPRFKRAGVELHHIDREQAFQCCLNGLQWN